MTETIDKKDFYVVEGTIGSVMFWLADFTYDDDNRPLVEFDKDIKKAVEVKTEDIKDAIAACKNVLPFANFVSRHMRRIITTKIEVEVKEITHGLPVHNTSNWDERTPGGMS